MNTSTTSSSASSHAWTFFRSGGVDQVVLRNGADIANIGKLDQKLWMALGMPVRGVELDPRTADLLDADKDGRIRPREIIAAVEWAAGVFADLGDLMKGGDSLPLAAIKNPEVQAGAKRMLRNLGKPEADAIGIADIADEARIFSNTRFNGDGVVPADAAGDEALQKTIAEVLSVIEPVADRSGKPGINQELLDRFLGEAKAYCDWAGQGEHDKALAPLGIEDTLAAWQAVEAVQVKVNDYFARCRLAAYDARAVAALNREESAYLALAAKDLTLADEEMAALPLAAVAANKPLPLTGGLNPAWEAKILALHEKAVTPILGAKTAITGAEWETLKGKLSAFAAWHGSRPATAVSGLGLARLKELLGGNAKDAIAALIAEDAALAGENAQFLAVEKAVRFQRDLYKVLVNYINFGDFYGQKGALFQVGTLYLDARACHLCIDVTDEAKHTTMAGLSGAYLAYCELTRPGGCKRSIVAAFTDGDSDNLMPGRNGVFYDRAGLDWDATITRVVANPISIREAFWLPYKKFIRFVEEQVAKRAQAADEASSAKLSDSAAAVTAASPKPAAPPLKKIDLGTIALIGVALGGISALFAGLLQAFFGLGIWLPLGVVGLMLLISGPSMLLAWLKLRNRNLGPILDANGWAINTKARLNVPLGAALTHVARLPEGASRLMVDPFAEKKRPWKTYGLLLAVAVLGYLWWSQRLDAYLPEAVRREKVSLEKLAPPPELLGLTEAAAPAPEGEPEAEAAPATEQP